MKKELLMLPFDHHRIFKELLGQREISTPEGKSTVNDYKWIIYNALLKAVREGLVAKEEAAILIDEDYGGDIILDAKKRGITFALTCEKSGQTEFQFAHPNYKDSIERFKPRYAKVLVRYNPEGDEETKEMNKRQLARLKEFNDYLLKSPTSFLLELLVPPTKEQERNEQYDSVLRPLLTRRAISEMDMAGIKPQVWKLQGVEAREEVKKLSGAVKRKNPDSTIIILGHGSDEQRVEHWLRVARGVEGVVGFAIGRTIFWDAIKRHHRGELSGEDAVEIIKENYARFVKVWKG